MYRVVVVASGQAIMHCGVGAEASVWIARVENTNWKFYIRQPESIVAIQTLQHRLYSNKKFTVW